MKTKVWKKKMYSEKTGKDSHLIPCWICGKKLSIDVATVDHVIPQSLGVISAPSNYGISCKTCNGRKGSKILSRKTKPKRNWNSSQRGY